MARPLSRLLFCVFCGFGFGAAARAQDSALGEAKRVTVSQNNDGSRTTYEIDGPSRKEVATTIGEDGKVKGLIRYDLDEAGHFQKGEVFGPAERFLFKTLYKYDNAGRLQEETQLTKENVMKNKLVYSYDALTGRQTGYSIYDAAGKLLGQVRTNAPRQASTPPPGKR